MLLVAIVSCVASIFDMKTNYTIEELHELWDEKNKITSVPRTMHGSPEHDMQKACVEWFRYKYPKHVIFSIPNGGYRGSHTRMVGKNLSEAAAVTRKLKEEGMQVGMPDLCIAVMRCGYGGMYVEMKNGKAGRLSDEQKEQIAKLQLAGYYVIVCRSTTQFMNDVTAYMESRVQSRESVI